MQKGSIASVQAVHRPHDGLTDQAPATTRVHLDANDVLLRQVAELGHLPAGGSVRFQFPHVGCHDRKRGARSRRHAPPSRRRSSRYHGCMHLLLYVWVVQAGSCEVLYIFMLCFPSVAVVKECKMNHFYGLAIGHDIVARTCGAGSVSGGCVNFAVATGIDVSNIRFLLRTGVHDFDDGAARNDHHGLRVADELVDGPARGDHHRLRTVRVLVGGTPTRRFLLTPCSHPSPC
jgi:hypothetical protein